jgi:hypothetical protein
VWGGDRLDSHTCVGEIGAIAQPLLGGAPLPKCPRNALPGRGLFDGAGAPGWRQAHGGLGSKHGPVLLFHGSPVGGLCVAVLASGRPAAKATRGKGRPAAKDERATADCRARPRLHPGSAGLERFGCSCRWILLANPWKPHKPRGPRQRTWKGSAGAHLRKHSEFSETSARSRPPPSLCGVDCGNVRQWRCAPARDKQVRCACRRPWRPKFHVITIRCKGRPPAGMACCAQVLPVFCRGCRPLAPWPNLR